MTKKQKRELAWIDKNERRKLEPCMLLSNLESVNAVLIYAVLIHQSLAAPKRLAQLNTIAITQMRSFVGLTAIKQLSSPSKGKEKLR